MIGKRRGLHRGAGFLAGLLCAVVLFAALTPASLAQRALGDELCDAFGGAQTEAAEEFTRLLVMDADSGQVVQRQNAEESFTPTGSAVALMTAYIAATDMSLDTAIVISNEMLENEDFEQSIDLQVGDEVLVRDLIASMCLKGAQDSAVVLAKYIAGSVELFVERMNETAQALGMQDTVYVNPTGAYAEGQSSTAEDVMRLVYAVYGLGLDEDIFAKDAYIPSGADSHMPERIDNRVTLLQPDAENYDARVAAGYGGGSSQAEGFNAAVRAQMGNVNLLIVACSPRSERRMYAQIKSLLDELEGKYSTIEISSYIEEIALAAVAQEGAEFSVEPDAPVFVTGSAAWSFDPGALQCTLGDVAQAPEQGATYAAYTVSLEGKQIASGAILCTGVVQAPDAPPTAVFEPVQTPIAQENDNPVPIATPEGYQPYERTMYDRFGWLFWSLAALAGGAAVLFGLDLIEKRMK